MINDPIKLAEVLEEIAERDVGYRRAFIASIERAFGVAAAQQLRDGLTAMWQKRK